jgi:VCBS repeat-containing protein
VFKSSTSSAHLPGFNDGTSLGTFTIDPSVTELATDNSNGATLGWHFSLDNSNHVLQSLAQGQSITEVYTVTFTDNHGAQVSQDVTITINGINDAPTITSSADAAKGAVIEDADTPTLCTGGTLAIRDVDLIDTHTATAVFKSSSVSSDLPGFGSTSHIGTFTIDPSVAESVNDTSNGATLGWHFTLDDRDPTLQSLAEGQTITQIYTVTFTDNHGASVSQDVTVTITGTNDAPTLSDVKIGTLADTAATDSFSDLTGHLHGSDVDTGEAATLTYAVLDSPNHAVTTVAGHYGSLTVNLHGAYSYVADAAAINALPAGSYSDNFTVQTTDAHEATGTATLTVEVTGANDAPVFNVDQISVKQYGDELAIVRGLSVTDADAAANEPFKIVATTHDWGSFVSPSWKTGSLAEIDSKLQAVTYWEGFGEPSTDRVKLTVTDGHGATDTINLIYNLAENANDHVSLVGTIGKDVFLGTSYQDQFVFAANSNHDTIVNFTPGQDHVNLSAVVTASDVGAWMAQHVAASPTNSADTLITIDSTDTILLKGVSASSLHASDFILHS